MKHNAYFIKNNEEKSSLVHQTVLINVNRLLLTQTGPWGKIACPPHFSKRTYRKIGVKIFWMSQSS